MSDQRNKMNANAQYTGGATKENAGYVIGSDRAQAEGRAEKERGNANYETAQADTNYKGPSKVTGQLHATKGAAKETLGSLFNKDTLQHSGAHERRTGNQEVEAARTKNTAQGVTGQVKGNAKEKYGHATGNPQKETEGRAEHVKGENQYHSNQ